MALSEIEKLERRYAENPQGLTFAPLAEVHRKNGDVGRALELLRPGLTLHPDYIPASIVLGRCHLDLGDLPAAETAFTHVLSLDAENVIALKSLADITERQYRFDESERWLRTLLAVDRSNDEARDQLGRVEAARRQAETGSSAAPDAAGGLLLDEEPAPAGDAPAGATADRAVSESPFAEAASAPGMSPPPAPEPPAESMLAWAEPSGTAAAESAAPLELEELDLGADATPPDGIELEQPVSLEEPVEPLSGLVGRHDQEPGTDLHVAADGWQVETAEDIVLESAGGGEFQVANAAEELLSTPSLRDREPSLVGRSDPDVPAPEPEPASVPTTAANDEPVAEAADEQPAASPAPDSPVTAEAEAVPADAVTRAAVPVDTAPVDTAPVDAAPVEREAPPPAPAWTSERWSPPVAEQPRHSEADLVVTESMAEVLLQQGHTAEALTVYRHLEGRTSGGRYREKIAELERMATAAREPTPSVQDAGAPEPPVPPAPAPSYSVRETHGQSVQSFLRGVLGARPPAPPAAAPVEQPRVAADTSTGGAPTRPAHDSLSLSSVFGEESTPTPPAVSTAGSTNGPAQTGVSYDEFFGGATSGPSRPTRSPDSKSDDLDQFHAWLQNLKR